MIPEMCQHPAPPELAVVRHREVQKLVDNHIVAKLTIEGEQFIIEIQIAGGGVRRPFAAHRAHIDCRHLGIELSRPLLDARLKLSLSRQRLLMV